MSLESSKKDFQNAKRLYEEGRYEEALALLDQVSEELHNSRSVAFARGLCLVKLGRLEEAGLMCDRLEERRAHERAQRLREKIQQRSPSPVREASPLKAEVGKLWEKAVSSVVGLAEKLRHNKRLIYLQAMCMAKLGRAEQADLFCDYLIEKHGYERAQRLKDKLKTKATSAEQEIEPAEPLLQEEDIAEIDEAGPAEALLQEEDIAEIDEAGPAEAMLNEQVIAESEEAEEAEEAEVVLEEEAPHDAVPAEPSLSQEEEAEAIETLLEEEEPAEAEEAPGIDKAPDSAGLNPVKAGAALVVLVIAVAAFLSIKIRPTLSPDAGDGFEAMKSDEEHMENSPTEQRPEEKYEYLPEPGNALIGGSWEIKVISAEILDNHNPPESLSTALPDLPSKQIALLTIRGASTGDYSQEEIQSLLDCQGEFGQWLYSEGWDGKPLFQNQFALANPAGLANAELACRYMGCNSGFSGSNSIPGWSACFNEDETFEATLVFEYEPDYEQKQFLLLFKPTCDMDHAGTALIDIDAEGKTSVKYGRISRTP